MEESKKISANLKEPANFMSNAFKLAVTTALRLADFTNKSNEETNGENSQISLRVSPLPEIPLSQVSWHDHYEDCWIVLYDRVYDVTKFLEEHPGGVDVLLEYAGRDATLAYRGFGHSAQAWQILQKYLIGILPEEERTGMFKEEKMLGRNLQLRAASS